MAVDADALAALRARAEEQEQACATQGDAVRALKLALKSGDAGADKARAGRIRDVLRGEGGTIAKKRP